MIVFSRILKNDIRRNKQEIISSIVINSEFDGFFYYLYMDKYNGRIRLEMITRNSLIVDNEVALIKSNLEYVKKYLNKAIIQFNIGNIDISKYPVIKKLINDVKTKYGKALGLMEVNEPLILSEKYRVFK